MKPLYELVAGVQAVAEGDMERTISVGARDEVGRLASEFNKMVMALKERQNMLLASEYRYRSLFDKIHHGILMFDRDGDIIDSNPALAEIVGWDDVQMLAGIPFADLFANRQDYELLQGRIQHESDIRDLQLVFKHRKSGKSVEASVSITSQRDEKGSYEYSEAVIIDGPVTTQPATTG